MAERTTRGGRRRRSGQAVVEFALILPVFVLLVFAALEFGRAYYALHLLTNASREGARTGSLPNTLEADVTTRVSDFLGDVGLGGSWSSTVSVTASDGTTKSGLADATEGDRVEVAVTYNFTVLCGSILPGFSGTVPLTARCTFRHE